MARQSTKPTIAAIDEMFNQPEPENHAPGLTNDPGQIGEDEQSTDLALYSALAQIGESNPEAKVIIYRIDPEKKKDVWLYTVTVSEFADSGIQEIQDCYGEGEYRIRVYWENRVLTHRRVSVGASRTPKAAPGAAPIDLAGILATQQASMLAGFKELAASLRPASAGNSTMEMIQMINALRPLMAAPTQAATPAVDPLEMIGKIVRLQRDLAPIPTDADGGISGTAILMKAMDTFGPVLAKGLNGVQGAAPGTPTDIIDNPVQSLPAPALDAGAADSQPAPERQPAMNDLQMKVAIIAPMILLAAANQADPYPYACNCLDLFDDEQLAQYIQSPDWWKNLIAILPDAEKHPAWFGKLREEVLTILREPAESDTVIEQVSQ